MTIAASFISGPRGITVETPHAKPSDIALPHLDVKGCIGGTGKASVFLAYNRDERRDVAVKVVRIPRPLRQAVTDSLEREIQICRRLPTSPAILPAERLHFVPNTGDGDMGVIEMAFADGGSLRDWLSKRQNDVTERRQLGLDIFRGLCAAVGVVHEAGIVHLDIKPENVLFVHGVLKLADFGAAAVLPHRVAQEADDDALSRPDPQSGTPEYMSPERWNAQMPGSVDERADVYALGTILWELFSPRGVPPFEGSPRRVARLHAESAVPEIAIVPQKLMGVIRKCLAKRPADRYRHIDDLLDAVDDACAVEHAVEDTPETKVANIRNAISEAIAAKEWSRARRWCERLLAILPGDEMAAEVLAYVADRRAEADALYQTLMTEEDRANLNVAVCLMGQAMDCFPGHPLESVVAIRLVRQAIAFRESLDACVAAALSGDLCTARGLAARALGLNKGATEVARLLGRLEQQISEVGHWRQRLCDAVGRNDVAASRLASRRLEQLGVSAQGG